MSDPRASAPGSRRAVRARPDTQRTHAQVCTRGAHRLSVLNAPGGRTQTLRPPRDPGARALSPHEGAQCRVISLLARRPKFNCSAPAAGQSALGGGADRTLTQPSPLPADGVGDPSPDPHPWNASDPTPKQTSSHTFTGALPGSPPAPPTPFRSPTSRPWGPSKDSPSPTRPSPGTAELEARRPRLRSRGGCGGGGWRTWGSWGEWAAFSPPPLCPPESRSLQRGRRKGAEVPQQGPRGCGEVAGGVVLCPRWVGHSGMSHTSPADAHGGLPNFPSCGCAPRPTTFSDPW